jgi:hypothetical protein
MRKLYPLPNPAIDYFDDISTTKRPPRDAILTALRPEIDRLYRLYTTNSLSLHLITPESFTPEQKEALHHCYSSPNAAMDRLRLAIINHQMQSDPYSASFCQYCGINTETRSLDHYLPKEQFAEFSALSLNIVPSCLDCNILKDTAWLNGGSREIISFYYDALPNLQFLHASTELTGGMPFAQFTLSSNTSDYCGMESIIRSHFSKLQLLKRYSKAATGIMFEHSDSISSLEHLFNIPKPDSVALLSTLVLRQAEKLKNKHSPNYWKVALYQGMAANPAFLEWSIDNSQVT